MGIKTKPHAVGICAAAAGILIVIGSFLSDVPGTRGARLVIGGMIVALVLGALLMENRA